MHVEYVLNAFQNGKREHFWCMLHNACYIFFFHLQYIINACRHAKILLGKGGGEKNKAEKRVNSFKGHSMVYEIFFVAVPKFSNFLDQFTLEDCDIIRVHGFCAFAYAIYLIQLFETINFKQLVRNLTVQNHVLHLT
jgi:hypothetical protein